MMWKNIILWVIILWLFAGGKYPGLCVDVCASSRWLFIIAFLGGKGKESCAALMFEVS